VKYVTRQRSIDIDAQYTVGNGVRQGGKGKEMLALSDRLHGV